ncbi:MAG: TIGR03905 family TSCPD domain-containing protein [Lachnospirales bacterium]
MQYTYKNKGVCSRETIIDINPDHTIEDIKVIGGCDGNLKGIMALLKGAKAEDVIPRLQGLTCGYKNTSCPDQIANALEEAIAKLDK